MLTYADQSLSVQLVSVLMAHAPSLLATGQRVEAFNRVLEAVSASKALAPLASVVRTLLVI
jgi:hypothetical protein